MIFACRSAHWHPSGVLQINQTMKDPLHPVPPGDAPVAALHARQRPWQLSTTERMPVIRHSPLSARRQRRKTAAGPSIVPEGLRPFPVPESSWSVFPRESLQERGGVFPSPDACHASTREHPVPLSASGPAPSGSAGRFLPAARPCRRIHAACLSLPAASA